MLTYNHCFNSSKLDLPYHVHVLNSSTNSVIVRVNGISIGEVNSTVGDKYSFDKKVALPYDVWYLLVVGSMQTYSPEINSSIYKNDNIRYIRNGSKYLTVDAGSNEYYWSDTKKTRFYFNPFYFSSTYLWTMLLGYVPAGQYINNIWTEVDARTLFNTVEIHTTTYWEGKKVIESIPEVKVSYFEENPDNPNAHATTLHVDHFIDKLQDLNNGDILEFDNGQQRLQVVVENCTTKAEAPELTVTDRPIVHVPIQVTNPNKKVLYAKAISAGHQETINLSLYNNNIEFKIQRTN